MGSPNKLLALLLLLAAWDSNGGRAFACPGHRWWATSCGNVQPLGVMAGGHSIEPPKLLHRVDARRPAKSRRGIVIVETVLTARGTVCAARVLRGLDRDANRAALSAVLQWRFTPVRLNGVPRPAFYNVTVAVK